MSQLLAWMENKSRKPLILEGARQVAKTWLLKEFGKRFFKRVAYVNFQNPSREITELFDGSRGTTRSDFAQIFLWRCTWILWFAVGTFLYEISGKTFTTEQKEELEKLKNWQQTYILLTI